jgi:hypothetical protein
MGIHKYPCGGGVVFFVLAILVGSRNEDKRRGRWGNVGGFSEYM